MTKYLIAAENNNPHWIDWTKKEQPLTEFQWPSSLEGGLKSPNSSGIWCFNRPFIIPCVVEEDTVNKEVAVLLLYAQSSQNYRWTKDDSALMGLAIVASSCTIFNVQKHIDENCFSSLASHFKYVIQGIQGNGYAAVSATTIEKIQACLGKAVFAIWDWNFPTEYPYGIAGGEKFLKEVKLLENQGHSKESRLGRTFVRTAFEEVSGCLLPFPGCATLRSEFQGSIAEMEKFFVDKLGDFISEVVNLDELPLKRVLQKNKLVDGATPWKALIERYLNVVNSGEVESKQLLKFVGVKDLAHLKEQKEVMKKAMRIYGDAWKGLLAENGTVVKEKDLKENHRRARKKALEAFQDELADGSSESEDEDEEGDSMDEIKDYLKKRLDERFQEIKETNEKKRMEWNETSKKILIQQYKDSMGEMFPSEAVPSEESLIRESGLVIKDLLKDFEKKMGQKNVKDERDNFMEQLKNVEKVFVSKRRGITTGYYNHTEGHESGSQHASTLEENSKSLMSYQSSLLDSTETLPCTSDLSLKWGKNSSRAMDNNSWPSFSFEENKSLPNKSIVQTQPVREFSSGIRNKEAEELLRNQTASLIERLKHSYVLKLESSGDETAENGEMERRILEEFKLEVAFSEESQEFKLHREMLEAELKMAKTEAKMKSKKSTALKENNIKQAVKEALTGYKNKLEALVAETRVMTANQLETASETFLQEELKSIFGKVSKSEFQKLEREVKEKIDEVFVHFKKENEANNQQEKRSLISSCREEYVKKMTGAMAHAKNEEDLQQAEESHRMKIMEKFRRRSGIQENNDQLAQDLDNILSQVFTEMKPRFTAKLEGEAGMDKLMVASARQFYCEEMEKHFKNDDSILLEDLLKMHELAVQNAIKRIKSRSGQEAELREALKMAFQKYEDLNKMNMDGEPAIGIDLGTTFSAVSVYQRGQVKIIPNSMGKMTTPSYVLFQPLTEKGEQQEKIVGEEAKLRAYENPEGTIFDAKRILGRKYTDEKLQEDMKLWPFSVVDGGHGVPMIEVNGSRLNPEEISAIILAQLKQDAENYLKRKVKKAVITVPAYFTDGQKQATIDAGKMAKLEVLSVLAEPVAAAMAYNLQYISAANASNYGERHILIFDLGGGTFDVAVLKRKDGEIEVLTKDGDTHLGGEDFDKNMMTYCAEEFKKQHNVDLFQGKDCSSRRVKDDARRRLKRLQAECERQKILLTTGRSATVSVKKIHKNLELSVKITRATFEKVNDALFTKTIQVVDKALQQAALDRSRIDDIVLVGGSTRIPKIQRLLEGYFKGKQLDRKINPDEAVAHGAGLYAAIRKGDVVEGAKVFTKFRDVTPMSIGVELYGGGFDVIIPKSTKIPVKLQEQYKTAHNSQTSVQITIYEGENPIAVKNEKLGDFYLNGISPKNAGAENIDVEMVIDEQGILHVTASCGNKKNSKAINVTENKQRIGEATIKRYLAAADNIEG